VALDVEPGHRQRVGRQVGGIDLRLGQASAASTARLPLPVHRSSTRCVVGVQPGLGVPSASTSAISERGTITRSSTWKGRPCSQASPVR
jgi:hypothetical protein